MTKRVSSRHFYYVVDSDFLMRRGQTDIHDLLLEKPNLRVEPSNVSDMVISDSKSNIEFFLFKTEFAAASFLRQVDENISDRLKEVSA